MVVVTYYKNFIERRIKNGSSKIKSYKSVSIIGNGKNVHMWSNADILQQKFYIQDRGNEYFSLQSAYGNKLFKSI